MMRKALTAMSAIVLCASVHAADAQEVPVVLFPFHEATVAAAVDTELKDYRYLIGEAFTNGAVIAELDDTRYRLAYERANEHRLFTERVAAEQRELRQKDFSSEMELRKAEYEAKIAAADCAEAELNLSRCRLTAPFNGKFAELLTHRFETVKPGQPLYRIIEDGRLLAVANLPLGRVAVGDEVRIVPDGCGTVAARVYEVAPQADNRTGTVRVRVLVDNASGELSAGMTGVLQLIEKKPAEAPLANSSSDAELQLESPGVPFAAVENAFGGSSPFVAIATNEAHLAEITANRPAALIEREPETVPLGDGRFEVRYLPPLSITGLRFRDGVLAFSLHRFPRSVSLRSLKRIGEVTAGIYDDGGNRLVYLEPRQVELPGAGSTTTNIVAFSGVDCDAAIASGKPLKLIVRVETDIRVLDLSSGSESDGGE